MANVKRQIKPSLRQRQAQITRDLIVTAAQALFLERGYTGTTIESIAEQAGVAVSTVYAVFGSKRGILRAIREAWHGRSHIREVAYGDPGTALPEERLEQLAQATRNQWETGCEVMAIYNGASHADPEAAAELAEALEGRRKGMKTFARNLEPHLRPDLSVARATAILQALCLSEVFDELVNHSGWSMDAYQAWLAEALKRELLERTE
ncbi:MAG: TetR/AcrR family transcriptional regulator [Anaerolineales bacterium]|nr:TetR/AcrR family transcriptional regulator [Anaerolineales bacterium]